MGQFGVWQVEKMRESSAPSVVLMGVERSLSDEQVAQGVIRGTRGLLPNALKGKLGQVRAKRLSSAVKGAAPLLGPSTHVEAQPTRNVRLYCCHEVLDCMLKGGFVKVNWDLVRVHPYEPARFFCKKCGRMGAWGATPQNFIGHLRWLMGQHHEWPFQSGTSEYPAFKGGLGIPWTSGPRGALGCCPYPRAPTSINDGKQYLAGF